MTSTTIGSRVREPQADLIARLVEVTAKISMGPLPLGRIVDMHRKLDALEAAAMSIVTEDGAEPPSQEERPQNPAPSECAGTAAYQSLPATTTSRSIWPGSERSSIATRPTTVDRAGTRSTASPSFQRSTLNANPAMEGPSQSSRPGTNKEPESRRETASKSVLEDISRLVNELRLHQEESRHIHDLALAKADAATKEIAKARKGREHLGQLSVNMRASLESISPSIRYLTASMNRIEARLDELVIGIASHGEVDPAALVTEATSVKKRIERWRRDCANVEAEVAKVIRAV